MRTLVAWSLGLSLLLGAFGHDLALAGSLGAFERDATTRRPERHAPPEEQQPEPSGWGGAGGAAGDSDDDGFNPFAFFDMFVDLAHLTTDLGHLASTSWVRMRYDRTSDYDNMIIGMYGLEHKRSGETLLPSLRLDYNYQNLESDVSASDYRMICGYGPLAVVGRTTNLREEDPPDKMRIEQVYGVYRLSFTPYVEVGLGFGQYRLTGQVSSSGDAFTLPVTIRFNKSLSLEFLPAWTRINGNDIEDYDLGLLAGTRYVSGKIGFRRIESPGDRLQGPYLGVSFYY